MNWPLREGWAPEYLGGPVAPKEDHMTHEIKDPDAVVVKIDMALKKLYAFAIAQLDEAGGEGAAAWHKKYSTVATIVDHVPPMYLAGGFATDQAFFTGHLKETQQSALRNVRVAKLATAHEVERYSVARLSFAIAYIEARGQKRIKSRGELAFDELKIHFTRDGKGFVRSLLDISYADLKLAVVQATGHDKKPPKQSPAAKAVIEAVKASGVKDVKTTVTKTMVTLRMPLTGLSAVARELAGFKLPKA